MLVDERRKLLIFMNVSFGSINRIHLVCTGDRPCKPTAYWDRGELATVTSGWNKSATPVRRRLLGGDDRRAGSAGELGGPGVDQKWTDMVPFRSTSGPRLLRSTLGPPSVHFSDIPRTSYCGRRCALQLDR